MQKNKALNYNNNIDYHSELLLPIILVKLSHIFASRDKCRWKGRNSSQTTVKKIGMYYFFLKIIMQWFGLQLFVDRIKNKKKD